MKRLTYLLFCLIVGIGMATAQTTRVTGTVISADDGEPVIGASVSVKGTTVGTVTDLDGNFTLNVPSSAQTLVVSYVGMTTQEVPIRSNVRVVLESGSQQLDEVMVVAYGTTKKSSFTGSAVSVRSEQLNTFQTNSFTKALEGAAAGIEIGAGNGQPGSGAKIRIRGFGSINASNDPLYVVDGAPFDGDITTINTDDIEAITVLKDATSAALYGSRGANGVILIATKKGTKGKATVSAKINLGVASRAMPEYSRVGSGEYYELMWEGWRNALVNANGFTPEAAATTASSGTNNGIVARLGGYNSYNVANDQLIGTDGKLNSSARLLYEDNWTDELSRLGFRQDYSFSMNGGSEQANYFASLSYINEEGTFIASDYERFTARVGVNSEITSWLKVEAGLSGAKSKDNGFMTDGSQTTNPFYFSRMMGPIYPVYQYDDNGSVRLDGSGNKMYDMGGGNSEYAWAGHTRPYAPNSNLALTLPLDTRGNERNEISARVAGEIKFLNDFTLRISGNQDISQNYRTTYQNNQYGDALGVEGRSTKAYVKKQSYTFNQILTWNKTFNLHSLSLLAGHENYMYSYKRLEATRTGFTIPTTELVAGAVGEGSSSYVNQFALEGYLFQANYDYDNKYYVSGSFRYDGSSRFHKDSRWGAFWSLGASWRISEEDFMQDITWVNNLKLKASYGQQGNDNLISPTDYVDGEYQPVYYGWQSLYSFDDRNNANFNGAVHNQLLNRDLAWEKNSNLNVGVEFAFADIVRGEIDFFNRESSNLLFQVPNPQSTGIEYIWKNIGTMYNRGFEFTLGFDILRNTNLKWSLDLNATTYKNKITKMPKNTDGSAQEMIVSTKKLSEGKSIYEFWLREFAGVDPSNGDALYYKDITDSNDNVTGRETTNDQNAASYYYVGSSIPDLYGGITNTFRYKGFDLSILLSYQIGGKAYDYSYAALMHPGSFGTNWSTDIRDRWQQPGDITDIPRLQNSYTAANAASSRWLVGTSYLSIRNISLSYTLPKKIQNMMEMKDCRVFVVGDNLAIFSQRKGFYPRQSFSGNSEYRYTPTRIISFGVNVTF